MVSQSSWSLIVVGILLLLIGAACDDDYGGGGGEMEEEELFGLFEVMGSLLEDPTWAEMHPLPCTETPWPGVECGLIEETSVFHVTKIHVGDDVIVPPCKSSANISPSLLKLPFIRTLSLFNCFTQSPVSLSRALFTSLSSLEHLTLDSNPALVGEIPPTISNLSSLKTLCLSQNNLSGEIPQEIGRLINLQQLVLSQNNLTGQIPQEIGFMKKLSILDLSFNSLRETVPSSIGELSLLEKIDLSWNKLRGAPPPELGKLRKLSLLDLSHNLLQGPIPENISGMQQLEYLIMEGNPLNSSFPSSVTTTLTRLVVLSLSGCGLFGSIPANVFSNMSNLTALYLDDNRLSGRVPAEIGRLRNLDTLNLSGNHLKGQLSFPEEFINRIGERLDIRENDGLCGDVAVRTSNMSSRFLQSPACADVIFPAPANNNTLADKNQDLYDDATTSASDHHGRPKGRNVILLAVFVFVFVARRLN